MSPVEIDYLGEGRSDEVVARKIIVAANGVPGKSYRRPVAGTGKQSLDRRLAGLNAGAPYSAPILVLRDLNSDAPCPAELIRKLLANRHPHLLLRVCVREMETWLMADREAYAGFSGLKVGQLPISPEGLPDPKAIILGWADSGRAVKLKRYLDEGRRRGVPDWAILGEWHADFAETVWNPLRASAGGQSPSLTRSLGRVRSAIAEYKPAG